MALCKTTVLKVYTHVMEDVISGVRDIFTDEGVDEQVLQELKSLWESKLQASKAVDMNPDATEARPAAKKPDGSSTSNTVFVSQPVKREGNFSQAGLKLETTPKLVKTGEIIQQQQQTNNQIQTVAVQQAEDKMIPIQITLPTQPTIDAVTRVLTIHVPASALNGPQLHTLLTGPVITATMGLPTPLASSLLQQHVNAALQSQQQQLTINKVVMPQMDGAADVEPKKKRKKKMITIEFIRQADGATDTSDEDDDGSEEDASEEEIDDDKEEDDPELDDGAPEEEPLNSEDDVTDEEPTDLFDTDNVVVCQYDKITRSRNKWKFYLKDGIMNLEGEDFVFQKANGDAEW